jgi:hypothetical protein
LGCGSSARNGLKGTDYDYDYDYDYEHEHEHDYDNDHEHEQDYEHDYDYGLRIIRSNDSFSRIEMVGPRNS